MILILMLSCLGLRAPAQVTYAVTNFADAFLATGAPGGTDWTGLNFGAAGTLVVAAASSPTGEFQSIMKFDTSGASNLFNATYGTNNWLIKGITLALASNDGIAGQSPDNTNFPTISGGQFVIEWLSDDNWVEGTGMPKQPTMDGVTYDSLPVLLSGPHGILNTNTYTPPGDNIPVTYSLPLDTNLVNDVTQGGPVTLLFYAADDQIAYLFNSHNFGGSNQPLLSVTAVTETELRILSGAFTNGVFHLSATGVATQEYQIQANAELATTNWQSIGTATADSTGAIQFDDTTASNQPQRFYRLAP